MIDGAERAEGINGSTSGTGTSVSVIVPVGGAGDGFNRCLQSLSRLDPQPTETIVVIDGIDASFAHMAESAGATVVTLPESMGPSVARNRGAQAACGDLLFFVDADVELAPDSVARVGEVFEREPELAALIGSYDDDPAHPGFLSQYRNLLHHYVHQHGKAEASTFWGACSAIRRAVFENLGGFDEAIAVPSIEDIELGSRLRRAGHRIALVKDLQAKHLKRWRMGDMISTDLLRRAAPWTELMLRDGGLLDDLNVKTADRLSVVMGYIVIIGLIAGCFWPPMFAGALAAAVLLLCTNAGLYGFYRRRRGVFFAFGAVFWHWIYLLICGLGFAIGGVRHVVRRWRR
jgi:GT2 family glycosyltransferase